MALNLYLWYRLVNSTSDMNILDIPFCMSNRLLKSNLTKVSSLSPPCPQVSHFKPVHQPVSQGIDCHVSPARYLGVKIDFPPPSIDI